MTADNPSDPGNDSKYRTGKPCIERGCLFPAGTAWGPHWCQAHNAARLERISAAFDTIAAGAGMD